MNPSPPKNPAPSFFWKAMSSVTPFAAQRKASFCAMISPPIVARLTGMIFPGYGAANASFYFPCP